MNDYRKYFLADFEMLEAYDAGQYSYEDAYRFCFMSARSLAFGWI